MKGFWKRLIFSMLAFCAIIAFGEIRMRLPARSSRHVEQVRMAEPFPSAELVFRAENKQTKTVFSVYDTALPPREALAEIEAALGKSGWRPVMSTASSCIFENKSGKCAVSEAYDADGKTRAAVLVCR